MYYIHHPFCATAFISTSHEFQNFPQSCWHFRCLEKIKSYVGVSWSACPDVHLPLALYCSIRLKVSLKDVFLKKPDILHTICFKFAEVKGSFLHFISLTAPIVSWWMHVPIHANDKNADTVSKKQLTEGHEQGHITKQFQAIRTRIYMPKIALNVKELLE